MTDRQTGYYPINRYEDADRDLQLEVLGQESSHRWGNKRGDIATEVKRNAVLALMWEEGLYK